MNQSIYSKSLNRVLSVREDKKNRPLIESSTVLPKRLLAQLLNDDPTR